MTRFSRLFLIGALLLVTLGRPTPAAAVSAGCSTLGADGRLLGAGRLFIQASYGTDPATVMRFYVQGPETRTVYEGHDPQSFGLYLSNLTPGTYKWMLHSTYAVGDGTFIEQTNTLATCTVSGLIDVPALKGKTAAEAADTLAAAALSLGTVSSAASSTVAVGEIIKQNPAAGAGVTAGSRVAITVSSGPAPVATPKPTTEPVVTPAPSTAPVAVVPVVDASPSVSPDPLVTPEESAAPGVVPDASTGKETTVGAASVAELVPLQFAALPLGLFVLLVLLARRRKA